MLLSFKKDNRELLECKTLLKKHIEIEERIISIFEQDDIDIDILLKVVNELGNNKIIKEKITFIQDRPLDSKFLESYQEFSKEISYIQTNKDVPTLDISLIISFMNLFEETLLKTEKRFSVQDDIDGKVLVLTSKREKTPLVLKNNKKIVLTNSNFDLSDFNCSELIEILRVLDVIVSDNRYDILRAEIAKQIQFISSVSSLK